MPGKIKLTRPELKRQRDALSRFERFLPMLKLKQQQLQLALRDVAAKRREIEAKTTADEEQFAPYKRVLADMAGVNVPELATPEEVQTSMVNIAGVNLPVFEGVIFPVAEYSLFATPTWVDRALADLRKLNRHQAEEKILRSQFDLLSAELTKIIQRVNLFEKIKIPEARESIRVIRIRLGDEMTAAVGRAKIAKAQLTAEEATVQAPQEYSQDNGGQTDTS